MTAARRAAPDARLEDNNKSWTLLSVLTAVELLKCRNVAFCLRQIGSYGGPLKHTSEGQ